jgi:hypothetical protein
MKKGGLLLHGKKDKKFNTAVVSYFVAGATDFRFFSPGALWAVSSTGNHSTAEPYRFRHIAYLISSSTIYWYPPSTGEGLEGSGKVLLLRLAGAE